MHSRIMRIASARKISREAEKAISFSRGSVELRHSRTMDSSFAKLGASAKELCKLRPAVEEERRDGRFLVGFEAPDSGNLELDNILTVLHDSILLG